MLGSTRDFIGNILEIVLRKALDNPSLKSRFEHWKMTVLLETDYYPVTLVFDKGLRIERGATGKPDLKVSMGLDVVMRIARGDISMIGAFVRRRIRMKGLIRHPVMTFRFYRLMSLALGA